jgi:hypothetical protein
VTPSSTSSPRPPISAAITGRARSIASSHHPESLSHRRHHDRRGVLDRALNRRDIAEEANGVLDAELLRERAQCRLERPAAREIELQRRHAPTRLRECPQQDDVALDRDQPADAEETRHVPGVPARLAVRLDSVVHDLKAGTVEAFDLFEVARKPARDRDVRVGEARDRAVAEGEAAVLAELVEAVLRRDADRDSRQRPRQLPVDVGMDEVCVQDRRPHAPEVARDAEERDRIDVCGKRDRVERDSARAHLPREVPRARLVLVEHEKTDVPAALLQLRQQ